MKRHVLMPELEKSARARVQGLVLRQRSPRGQSSLVTNVNAPLFQVLTQEFGSSARAREKKKYTLWPDIM